VYCIFSKSFQSLVPWQMLSKNYIPKVTQFVLKAYLFYNKFPEFKTTTYETHYPLIMPGLCDCNERYPGRFSSMLDMGARHADLEQQAIML
jgi:hypothetical protein